MALVAAVFTVGPGVLAQPTRSEACNEALELQDSDFVGFENPCLLLVEELTEGLYVGERLQISPRALQLPRSEVALATATPAQAEPVPAVLPVALAGGSVAVAGTDDEAEGLVAVALNPFSLFGGTDATLPGRSDRADVTIIVPVTSDAEAEGDLRYFGLRGRLNITALRPADARYQQARAAVRAVASRGAEVAERLEELFDTLAPDRIVPCAQALAASAGRTERAVTACGAGVQDLSYGALVPALEEALAEVRRAADAFLLGLDLRADFGDPTLGAAEGAAGTRLFGGLVASRRLYGVGGADNSASVQLRLGALYTSLREPDETDVAVEGGLGFELARTYGVQRISAALGFDFRYSDAGEWAEALQTDFATFRAALNVPVSPDNSVTVGLALPVAGEAEPVLNARLNWSLPLPGARDVTLPDGLDF